MPELTTLAMGLIALAGGVFLLFESRRMAAGIGSLLARTGGSLLAGIGILVLLFGGHLLLRPLGIDSGAAGLMAIAKGQYGFLNNRGLYLPLPLFADAMNRVWIVLALGFAAAVAFYIWAGRRQARTGQVIPRNSIALALTFGPAAIALLLADNPVTFDLPKPRGFNLSGGWRVYPEFFALLLGLSLYTAAFIAEIVRAGILSVPKGQTEAASALGLRRQSVLKLVVVPQALRVIIPPLTNQYL
ncbi:MAG: ABC transporter permease subunit, partial [Hyphomicrobiales bacterium]|nr:ABC transporter permease subunit [Hyphomicrobiales bacterium]